MASAESWRGKVIIDDYEKRLGVVREVAEEEESLVLLTRFQSEDEDRKVWLTMRDDYDCLVPGEVRCRYRPANQSDLAKVKAATEARAAKKS